MSFTQQIDTIEQIGHYRSAYMAFLIAKKSFPKLNHAGHEPYTYGLSESVAEQIRTECDREVSRTA